MDVLFTGYEIYHDEYCTPRRDHLYLFCSEFCHFALEKAQNRSRSVTKRQLDLIHGPHLRSAS